MTQKKNKNTKSKKNLKSLREQKNAIEKINQLYLLYKNFKFIITNSAKNSAFWNSFYTTKRKTLRHQKYLDKAKALIDYLERSFSVIVWEAIELINNIFLENKKPSDLPYSRSSYYRKRNKSIKEFLEVLPMEKIEKIIKEYKSIYLKLNKIK